MDKKLFLPLISFLVAGTMIFIFWRLLMPDIADNQARIKAYDADISLAEAKIKSISESKKKLASISTVVNQLLVAIPEDVDAPDLVAEIETIAALNQVDLPSISPPSIADQATGSRSSNLLTTITVSGSFANIYNFINSLENSLRFAKIISLSLSSNDQGLSGTITFEVFARPNSGSKIIEGGDNE